MPLNLDQDALIDIAAAARRALRFAAGMDRDAFLADDKTQSAVIHQLLILGEATKRLSAPGAVRREETIPPEGSNTFGREQSSRHRDRNAMNGPAAANLRLRWKRENLGLPVALPVDLAQGLVRGGLDLLVHDAIARHEEHVV